MGFQERQDVWACGSRMKTVRTHFIHTAEVDESTGRARGTSPVTLNDLIK